MNLSRYSSYSDSFITFFFFNICRNELYPIIKVIQIITQNTAKHSITKKHSHPVSLPCHQASLSPITFTSPLFLSCARYQGNIKNHSSICQTINLEQYYEFSLTSVSLSRCNHSPSAVSSVFVPDVFITWAMHQVSEEYFRELVLSCLFRLGEVISFIGRNMGVGGFCLTNFQWQV